MTNFTEADKGGEVKGVDLRNFGKWWSNWNQQGKRQKELNISTIFWLVKLFIMGFGLIILKLPYTFIGIE